MSQRLNGTVVSYNDDRGFGFIRPDDGDADYFCPMQRASCLFAAGQSCHAPGMYFQLSKCRVAGVFVAASVALGSLQVARAQDYAPPPSPDEGNASFRLGVDPTVLVGKVLRVRFVIGCPTGTSTICSGRARLKTARRVPTRKNGPRRIVTIATGEFDNLAPGETVTITRKVRRAARYQLKRGCVTRAYGSVDNTASGAVRTRRPVRIRRC